MYNNDEMYVESSHTDYNFADYNLIHYYTYIRLPQMVYKL